MTEKSKEGLLTVLTPTYNRLKTLPHLAESLASQTSKNFEWVVIDDGSSDGTEEFFAGIKDFPVNITYKKKENGGKHTALNFSHGFINGDLILIADSDDTLTEDAVETVLSEWEKYKSDPKICGMSYLKGNADGTHLSEIPPEDFYVDDDISYRVNRKIGGDRCETVRTELFVKYPFPEFEGEKFMSEGWLWNKIAMEYDTVFRSRVIYLCEYLDDGLTKNGEAARLASPNCMAEYNKTFLNCKVRHSVRIKKTLLYIAYSMIAKRSFGRILKDSGQPFRTLLLFPFGTALKIYIKKR